MQGWSSTTPEEFAETQRSRLLQVAEEHSDRGVRRRIEVALTGEVTADHLVPVSTLGSFLTNLQESKLGTDSSSLGVEAFGLVPEACRLVTGVDSLPAVPKCDNLFPWIGGDVNERRELLGAAGARLVASANVDDRLYQDLTVFDQASPAVAQLTKFAAACGATPVKAEQSGTRRWRISADSEKQTWLAIANGVVLYLRFDMEIGDGFTSAEIEKILGQALRVAVRAAS